MTEKVETNISDEEVEYYEPVSPGYGGKVWNPILWAELRRWRARPITYSAFVIVALAGIIANYYASQGQQSILFHLGLLFDQTDAFSKFILEIRSKNDYPVLIDKPLEILGSFNNINYVLERWVALLLRPSTILPLLMVWRALISFRSSDFYGSLRTTFLRPRDFLWGIVGIPFWISAIILVLYTGLVLSPKLVEYHFAFAPDNRRAHPFWQIIGILFEGGLNGGMICAIALYFGLKWKARLSNIVPVILIVLFLQFQQALYLSKISQVNTFLFPDLYATSARDLTTFQLAFKTTILYYIMGVPKIFVIGFFWFLATREIRKSSQEPVSWKQWFASWKNPFLKIKYFRQQQKQES